MATYFNSLGPQTVTGSAFEDYFWAFTRSTNVDDILADSTLALLSWTTAILQADGTFYTITAPNIQISQDLILGAERSDTIFGSSASDAIFYNNGTASGGFGGFDSIEAFFLGNGNDVIDLTAHGAGGLDYERNVSIHGEGGDDTIIGGGGNDVIFGEGGNDFLVGWRRADTIQGGAGDDIIYGDDLGYNAVSGDDKLYGNEGNDTIYGGGRADRLEGGVGNDRLYGGTGDDKLFGNADDDLLMGEDNSDYLDGGAGNDTLDGGAGSDELLGGVGDDQLDGGSGGDLMSGNSGNDTLIGGTGDDVMSGGAGNDSLDGGDDVDTARFTGTSSDYSIILNPDGSYTLTDLRSGSPDGTDTVRNVEFFQFLDGTIPVPGSSNTPPTITSDGGGATVGLTVAENNAAVTTVTATDPDTGQTITYSIAGGADAALFQIDAQTGVLSFINAPDFEAPADSNGDNVYQVIVRASDDNNGADTQTISVTVSNVVEGSAPVISSDGGGDTASLTVSENGTAVTTVQATDPDGQPITYSITGGADAALFAINAQTGVLTFKNAPDFEVPLDANGDGIYDVIVSAADGTTLTDTQALSVTVADVNENGRTLTGNASNNNFSPTQSSLAFQTTALNDTVYGLDGSDSIDGGGGTDTMYGGTGNDTYYVDTFSDDGVSSNDDQVIELAGEGVDTVNASVSYRMAAEVEKLILTGIAAINGFGNALANTMTGNLAANDLSGEDGNDILFGMGGNDRLFGGAGADALDGGLGADLMQGGADDDTYSVDTYSDDGNDANDDLVVELAGGGTDLVKASVSYRMAAEVEKLTLTGTDAINGTGNAQANTINGNSASNVILGDAGSDTLFGNGGDDFLYGEAGVDRLEGGGGNDLLDGGTANDTLLGGAGIDTLIGGQGRDSLNGGTEADTFVFGLNASALNSTDADTIVDFVTGLDKIDLPMLSGSIGPSAYVETTVASNSYTDALSAANGQVTAGVQAVFVAGTSNGWLFYDSNGDGALDQSIILAGLNNLGAFGPNDLL